MINVIRKQSTNNAPVSKISITDLEAIDVGNSVILLEPVKKSINITYDALGYADVPLLDLGVQYDHRVTWLHFNLDQLIWNLDAQRDYTADTKYNHYTFKLVFTKASNATEENTSVWEFDGIDFEVPRGVTKEAGLYKMVLIIEEFQDPTDDEFVGNIKNESSEYIERFVAAEIKCRVNTSIYNPEYDISVTPMETDQEAALIKPKIECTLSDEGNFTADVVELGQKHDNFIRYFKFNPRRITAHLNDFYVFAIFKQKDLFYYSLFERTNPDDPLDDYSASHPIIAWVPHGVYQTAGTWQVAIIAFTGNLEDLNNNNDNGDYYFFVSKPYKMRIAKNNLTEELATKEPILSITSNLVTSIGEVIITTDNDIYQSKN